MTTYRVWLTGQQEQEPETVRADDVCAFNGELTFYDRAPAGSISTLIPRRMFKRDQWRAWRMVHDDADHII